MKMTRRDLLKLPVLVFIPSVWRVGQSPAHAQTVLTKDNCYLSVDGVDISKHVHSLRFSLTRTQLRLSLIASILKDSPVYYDFNVHKIEARADKGQPFLRFYARVRRVHLGEWYDECVWESVASSAEVEI